MTKFLIWQRTENNKPNLFYKHIPNDESLTVEPADLSLLPRSVVPSLNLADSCSGSCHSGRDAFSSCQISCRLPYLLSLEHQANLVKTFRILWYDWFRIVFKDNKTLLKNSWFNVLSLVEHLYAKQLWFKSTRFKRAFQKSSYHLNKQPGWKEPQQRVNHEASFAFCNNFIVYTLCVVVEPGFGAVSSFSLWVNVCCFNANFAFLKIIIIIPLTVAGDKQVVAIHMHMSM